jgi:Spy/CpxP family protein refolding chaperone
MFDLSSRARGYALGALLCAAAVTVTACAHSQQTPPPDSASPRQYGGGGQHMRGGHRHGNRMLEGLNLTKDQRAQITLIHDRYRLQADSLRLNNSGHDSTSHTAFRSLMMQEMKDIRAVLTPDQQQMFDQKMSKMRERHRMHDRNGSPPQDSSEGPPA